MDPSLHHLLGRVAAVGARAEHLLAVRQGKPDEGRRAAELRAEAESDADLAEAQGRTTRLRLLARTFELSAVEVEALVIAAAPDLDPGRAPTLAALDGEAGHHVSVAVVLSLLGVPPWQPCGRALLGPSGRLTQELLVVPEGRGTGLRARLRVPLEVLAHVSGEDLLPDDLRDVLVSVPPLDGPASAALAAAVRSGGRLCYARQRRGGFATAYAVAALDELGLAPLVLDLDLVRAGGDDLAAVVAMALRQAQLCRRGLVLGPLDDSDQDLVRVLRLLDRAGWPVVAHGPHPWDPTWTASVPPEVVVADPAPTQRAALWGEVLVDHPGVVAPVDLRLDPSQAVRARLAAQDLARAAGRPLAPADLVEGARRQNGSGLERLARRQRPVAGWGDLVLAAYPQAQLRELVDRVRHRDVLRDLGVGGSSTARRGTTALLAGPPGTGKTLAVEVVAGELGVDCYAVDLSTVVDKYVGETEKNLERIFHEAAGVNGVLFFDEADALFGKRSEVNDAKDRHANVAVAYLLQRLEDFDGVAILATNLRANLDEAFARRIDVIVEFPLPDARARARLWEVCLGDRLPREPDVDLEACGQAYELSGGEIRNAAVTAALRATSAARPLTTADLRDAVIDEFRKLGRLLPQGAAPGAGTP